MEELIKKISLEPFYSRRKSTIPFVGYSEDGKYPSLNWGKIAYGVDFPKLANEPGAVDDYGEGIRLLGQMSFPELMSEYHRAMYGDTRNLTEEEIEKLKSVVLFVDSKTVIDDPDPIPDPCCDPCNIPSPTWSEDIDDGDYYIQPFMNVDLCLVQSANIIGAYTLATKDWEPGVKYYPGDKVFYSGKTYRLKEMDVNCRLDSSGTNCEGEPLMPGVGFITASTISAFTEYDWLSDDVFDEFVVTKDSEVVDLGYIYAKRNISDDECIYYIRPSWSGYFNKYDGIVYFDELIDPWNPESGFTMSGEYDTVHWKVVDNPVSNGAYSVSAGGNGDVHITGEQGRVIGFDNIMIIGTTRESKLVNFTRNTKTVTTEGVTLPGRLTNTNTSRVLDLEYLIGTVKNLDTTGTVPIADYLADIRITHDNGEEIFIRPESCQRGEQDVIADKLLVEYGDSGKYVRFQTLGDYENIVQSWADSGNESEVGWIVFRYYVGAEMEREKNDEGIVEKDAEYIYNGGEASHVFEDRYRFRVLTVDADIETTNGWVRSDTFIYIDINYGLSTEDVDFKKLFNFKSSVIMSDVTVKTSSVTDGGVPYSPNFQNGDYFMEEYQMGASFVANNNENVYIDRGSATAFERHMRLSEVDTLQDLENYGNGMFKMKE